MGECWVRASRRSTPPLFRRFSIGRRIREGTRLAGAKPTRWRSSQRGAAADRPTRLSRGSWRTAGSSRTPTGGERSVGITFGFPASQGIVGEARWVIPSSWSLMVEVAGRGGRRVAAGPTAERTRPSSSAMALDEGSGVLAGRLAGHAPSHGHHHVDDEVGVLIDGGVAVRLQVAEGPVLVERGMGLITSSDRARSDPERSKRCSLVRSAKAFSMPCSSTSSASWRSARARESCSVPTIKAKRLNVVARADSGSSGARRAAISSMIPSMPSV